MRWGNWSREISENLCKTKRCTWEFFIILPVKLLGERTRPNYFLCSFKIQHTMNILWNRSLDFVLFLYCPSLYKKQIKPSMHFQECTTYCFASGKLAKINLANTIRSYLKNVLNLIYSSCNGLFFLLHLHSMLEWVGVSWCFNFCFQKDKIK